TSGPEEQPAMNRNPYQGGGEIAEGAQQAERVYHQKNGARANAPHHQEPLEHSPLARDAPGDLIGSSQGQDCLTQPKQVGNQRDNHPLWLLASLLRPVQISNVRQRPRTSQSERTRQFFPEILVITFGAAPPPRI